MTEAEMDRFEFFVRSHLPRTKVKELISKAVATHQKVVITDEMAIVVGGVTKLYIAEIMEVGK
jgi:hypothetical protein